MGVCSVYICNVWMRVVLYVRIYLDCLGGCSVLSVYIWIVWMGLVLFCILKAAPPKIPSVCETNQVTMQRIQQPNRLLLFTFYLQLTRQITLFVSLFILSSMMLFGDISTCSHTLIEEFSVKSSTLLHE